MSSATSPFLSNTLYALCFSDVFEMQAAVENNRTPDIKPRITEDGLDKMKNWKLADIVESAQLKALRLPDPLTLSKVFG